MVEDAIHKPADRRLVPASRICRGFRAIGLLVVAVTPVLSGCSVSMPIGSMLPASNDDVTGSLADVPFGQLLDAEDRRREKAALATALDPQGDGSTIHWENPKTEHAGALTPVGHAYPAESRICRAFIGDYRHGAEHRSVQGTACTIAPGEWVVKDVKPFTKA